MTRNEDFRPLERADFAIDLGDLAGECALLLRMRLRDLEGAAMPVPPKGEDR